MSMPKFTIRALCLTTAIAGAGAWAVSQAAASATAATPTGGWSGHPHRGGGFRRALQQLNLSAEQKTQIQSILAQSKASNQALWMSMRENRQAMAAAMPNDANYPALVATAQKNAAARIQAASDLKTQIYAVLTTSQQAQLPGLIAAEQAARAAKIAQWRAAHSAQ